MNVMIWGWGMPASLWYFSGSVLAYLNGVDLTEQILPYFNDTLQGAIFLIMQHFLSAAMNKGFERKAWYEQNDNWPLRNGRSQKYWTVDTLRTAWILAVHVPD
jgi:hypothetical protein